MHLIPNKEAIDNKHVCWFPSTHWPAIVNACDPESPTNEKHVAGLLEKYFHPMENYVAIKFSGHLKNAKWEAADLVQDFIANVVLNGKLLKQVDPKRCLRFRNFLKTCLSTFILDKIRASNASKRRSTDGAISLEEIQDKAFFDNSQDQTASVGMDSTWARELFLRCTDKMKTRYEEGKRKHYWLLFEERFLNPYLYGMKQTPYEEIKVNLGFRSNKAAADAMREVKCIWKRIVRSEIQEYQPEPDKIEEELQYLIKCLAAQPD